MKAAPPFEITFLGTGTSQGVPMIACDCAVCHSDDPRDRRLRTAARIRTPEIEFVIDTPPDFRTQCLREKMHRIDAVLFTHAHTDHIMGFDDIRRFCEMRTSDMPVYATPAVFNDLKRVFAFAFDGSARMFRNYIRPEIREITGPFQLGDLDVVPVQLPHGRFDTTGYVFSRSGHRLLAYYTDCNAVPPEAHEAARDVELLVIDALRYKPHPTHLSVEQALEVAADTRAKRVLFTHIGHDLPQEETDRSLPPSVSLAYDGLKVTVP